MADDQTGAEEQIDAHDAEGETSTEDTSNDGALEGDTQGAGSEVQGDDDAGDVPVRKSAKDYIIERKDRKIAKLQGEDGADAEDQTDIRSIIQQELAPIKATFAKSADDQELQAALARYPEAKKMEATVRRYMENPAYAQIPVDFIVRGLLGAKEGAKKQADDEARGTRQGGHTRRPQEKTLPDFTKMTDEEFLAYDRKNR